MIFSDEMKKEREGAGYVVDRLVARGFVSNNCDFNKFRKDVL